VAGMALVDMPISPGLKPDLKSWKY